MAKSKSTRPPHGGKPSIAARDQHGEEYRLEVLEQHGMIVIRDDAAIRLIHPAAAIELALQLIMSTRGHFRGVVGPISGGF